MLRRASPSHSLATQSLLLLLLSSRAIPESAKGTKTPTRGTKHSFSSSSFLRRHRLGVPELLAPSVTRRRSPRPRTPHRSTQKTHRANYQGGSSEAALPWHCGCPCRWRYPCLGGVPSRSYYPSLVLAYVANRMSGRVCGGGLGLLATQDKPMLLGRSNSVIPPGSSPSAN